MLSPVKITVREHVVLPLAPEAAYDFFITPEAYRLFTGWGPIPGIREVVWESGEPATLGAYGRVHNACLFSTSPRPRDRQKSRMPSPA